jgi:hypothetical protein
MTSLKVKILNFRHSHVGDVIGYPAGQATAEDQMDVNWVPDIAALAVRGSYVSKTHWLYRHSTGHPELDSFWS